MVAPPEPRSAHGSALAVNRFPLERKSAAAERLKQVSKYRLVVGKGRVGPPVAAALRCDRDPSARPQQAAKLLKTLGRIRPGMHGATCAAGVEGPFLDHPWMVPRAYEVAPTPERHPGRAYGGEK